MFGLCTVKVIILSACPYGAHNWKLTPVSVHLLASSKIFAANTLMSHDNYEHRAIARTSLVNLAARSYSKMCIFLHTPNVHENVQRSAKVQSVLSKCRHLGFIHSFVWWNEPVRKPGNVSQVQYHSYKTPAYVRLNMAMSCPFGAVTSDFTMLLLQIL